LFGSAIGPPKETAAKVLHIGESSRLKGFAVSLSGTVMKTDGVVLCNQPRILDISARRGKRIERAPDNVIDEVLAALQDLLE
jgi:mRNA interferase ChpB